MKIIEGIQNAKLTISKYNKISNHLDSDQNTEFEKVVTQIIKRVKKDGDSALRFYAQSLDNVTLEQIELDAKYPLLSISKLNIVDILLLFLFRNLKFGIAL